MCTNIDRKKDWQEFATYMGEGYIKGTEDKYGTKGKAPDLESFTTTSIRIWNIIKYALRIWNGRGKEKDLEKIAHYAQMEWSSRRRTDK